MGRVYWLLFLSFFSSASYAHWLEPECSDSGYDHAEMFHLGINRSFHQEQIYFKFCKTKASGKTSYLLVIVDHKNDHDVDHYTIPFEGEELAEIEALFDAAWDYNRQDATSGTDGSYWCLQVRRSATFTKGCFYTPTSYAQQRGLEGLEQLGLYLWLKANLAEKHGQLF